MSVIAEPETVLPTGLLIGGRLLERSSAGTVDHVNPSTGKPQRPVVMAGVSEVDAAVAAARTALPQWAAWHPSRRRDALLRLAQLFRAHADEISLIGALENGIPIAMGPVIVEIAASWTAAAAVCCEQLHGDVINIGPGAFDYTLIEPVGVVGVITTWNGPIGSFGMCAVPALAAGCTVVLKPSELAPFTTLRMAQLCAEAGIPDGVVNVLAGGADAGEALVTHPDVAKISFTGGTPTARKISELASSTLTPLVLELGGKSANLIFDDADLTKAVASGTSAFRVAGQGCTMASRMLVHERVYDEVVSGVRATLEQMAVGDPLEPTTQMGPVINAASCDRIVGMIERAKPVSRLVTGGDRLGGQLAGGYFIPPTAFADVERSSEIARTEVFGPVLAISSFSDEDEAVALANDSEYGLAGYVHTRDVNRVLRVAAALDAGNIGVNGGNAPPMEGGAPFGGVKQSGYGREGGLAGVLEFTRIKNVEINMA